VLKSKASWKVAEHIDHRLTDKLAAGLNIEPLLAKLLVSRGITSVEEAEAFMFADQTSFYDPFLLKSMKQAVERIQKALNQREKIRIYGDYDADGVSSTSLMIYLLRQLEADFDYYIPHRANEGYGLNSAALEHAEKHGISLIITVDTGISSFDEIQYAAGLGIDVIVTDHHEPPEQLPEALAIINPKQPNCPYPFKQLAGVGVAFKLAHALLGRVPEELLQMAVIGTVADLMPLINENRLIVKLGLEQIRQRSCIGIKALCGVAGIQHKEITATHIGFTLAPRINASGRLDSAKDAVKLLTAMNEQEAEDLAFRLDQLNKERQRIVEDIAADALHLVETRMADSLDPVIVLEQEQWNVGVIGIVASKLLEKFYRPVIILSINPESGLAKGSARSIKGFDIYKALTECSEWLEHYGGHEAAAGMTIHRDHIPKFRDKLNQLAGEWLTDEDYIPRIQADMECTINELPLESIDTINKIAPFGKGNPSPRFIFKQLRIHDMKTIGKEQQHLKLMASQALDEISYTIETIGFGQGELREWISSTSRVDILGEVSINEWNGIRKPQLLIQDMRVTERQVFDWRGAKRSDWITRISQDAVTSRLRWSPALILSSPSEMDSLSEDIKSANCSLWVIDESGGAAALNEHAANIDFSEIKDLIFYSLPSELDAVKAALQQVKSVERIYTLFLNTDNSAGSLPSREAFKKVYSSLLQQKQWQAYDQRIVQALSKKTGMSKDAVEFIIKVFEELTFIEKVGNSYNCVASPEKRELESSFQYQQRMKRIKVEETLIYSTTQELTQWILKQEAN
jgi:single-stranded-DNA-specific exonuclease